MQGKRNKTSALSNLLGQNILTRMAVLLGKILPRRTGLNLASLIGSQIGRLKRNPMVKAIRANQWVIHGQSLPEEDLDELPPIIFSSAAKCIFDYFYFLSRPEKLQDIVDYSPQAKTAFDRIWNKKPCVIVCPHTSNFDLMGYALRLLDIDIQVLSYSNPNASYQFQNQLRKSLDINVTPLGFDAFRQARIRLREGGSILTGLDRPLNSNHEKYQPKFFGYETNLPVFYSRMAKEANAPVMIMAATSQPGEKYCLEGSELIWMESSGNLEKEIIHNTERVLQQAEPFIKKYADQWAMFYPIWPQFLGV